MGAALRPAVEAEHDVVFRYLNINEKRKVGLAAYGTFFEATHSENGKQYIVKRILLQDGNSGPIIPEKLSRATHDVNLLKSVPSHRNIVAFYGFVLQKTALCITSEYCNSGTLNDALLQDSSIQPKTKEQYYKNIVFGLMHLHKLNIAHTDLKPENILLSDGICKISNFGLAIHCNSKSGRKHYMSLSPENYGNRRGTRYFWSPEIADRVYNRTEATVETACDVFSLGLICLVLWSDDSSGTCSGVHDVEDRTPLSANPVTAQGFIIPRINGKSFSECGQFEIDISVKKSGISPDIISCVLSMLRVDAKKRPRSQDVSALRKMKTVSLWQKALTLIR